jgi:hypothetical protein
MHLYKLWCTVWVGQVYVKEVPNEVYRFGLSL